MNGLGPEPWGVWKSVGLGCFDRYKIAHSEKNSLNLSFPPTTQRFPNAEISPCNTETEVRSKRCASCSLRPVAAYQSLGSKTQH